jgi:hybrid cluster-associated redox disulfide protein
MRDSMIEKTTKLTELFKKNKKAAEIFRELGLSCVSCKGISEDTVEKVAVNNGLEINELLSRLNG